MIHRCTAVLCSLLTLTFPLASRANSSCTLARALETDAPAPCSGLLVPTVQAQNALLCLSSDLPLCNTELTFQKQASVLNIKALNKQLSIERNRSVELGRLLELASGPPPEPLWWQHPAFCAGVGVVVGAAVMYGAFGLAKDLQ